jgi:hypothetical protein
MITGIIAISISAVVVVLFVLLALTIILSVSSSLIFIAMPFLAGWLAGWLCYGYGESILANMINCRSALVSDQRLQKGTISITLIA